MKYVKMSLRDASPNLYKNGKVYKRFKWNGLNKKIYGKVQNSRESPNEIMHHLRIENVSRLGTA